MPSVPQVVRLADAPSPRPPGRLWPTPDAATVKALFADQPRRRPRRTARDRVLPPSVRVWRRTAENLAQFFPGFPTLAGRLSPQTLHGYANDAYMYLDFCQWHLPAVHDPQSLRAWRQVQVTDSAVSPFTINRRLSAVVTLVKASAACGALSSTLASAFDLVESVQVKVLRTRVKNLHQRLLTPEQVRHLCRAPDPLTLIGLRDRAFLATLASSGIRLAEACGLRLEDIQRKGPHVFLEVLGKNQARFRTAPLSHEAHGWIRRWVQARAQLLGDAIPWVFTHFHFVWPDHGPTGERLSRHGAYLVVKRQAEAVGLSVKPHDLRKFVGTMVAEKFGIRQAQKVLGHQKLETTEQHYVLDTLQGGLTEDLY